MSKLSNIVLLLTSLALSCTLAQPVTSLVSSIYDELDDDNYDIIIDQRQNGTENFRIRVNGLNIAIPSDEFEKQQEQTQITETDLASLFGIQTTKKPTMSLNADKDDFSAFASFFDFKKNLKSNDKKSLIDTQSRTKDIPTESQLSGDTKKTIKDFVKGEGRKYKLLVGEKYIIPLLQYLRQHVAAENDTDE
ncbi:hypothetical protein PVAND_010681 [Polypedilum vanderplanki]|uniref:Uncharacterized protein n=1 Tax=Polypedilum vanderplanki TaxID=319348 RepID=A0A9J6CHK1_POLVA|nr:hypothetical protein PVAND_010681 [Polypedilum vanderplanki]